MPRRRKVSRNKSAVNSRLSSEEPTRMSENRRESVEADEPPVPNHVDKNSSTSNGKTDVHELDYEENELEQLIITRLFNDIRFSDDVVSVLPDRSWAIHCTEEPVKRIVVSEISMVNFHGRGFEPFYVKQIIFDEKLNFELFLINSRTVLKDKPAYIKSITDFESLLDYVSGVKLCAGGPEFTKYSNVSPECAYKDPYSKWRHNLCTLEVHDADVCEACESLDEILKRHSQRTKSPLKSRNNVVATKRKKF
ncbi:GSCOCG00005146001-RA-CDS [Cotesia congregata]|nr:GSCOCG00005146001-RA-CDS [Cotesia congregata]